MTDLATAQPGFLSSVGRAVELVDCWRTLLFDLGRQDHLLWGMLLLVTLFDGPGRLSVDHWLKRRLPV